MAFESIATPEMADFKGLGIAYGEYHDRAHGLYERTRRVLGDLLQDQGCGRVRGHFDTHRRGGTVLALEVPDTVEGDFLVLGVSSPDEARLAGITLKAALAAHDIEPSYVEVTRDTAGDLGFDIGFSDRRVLSSN